MIALILVVYEIILIDLFRFFNQSISNQFNTYQNERQQSKGRIKNQRKAG